MKNLMIIALAAFVSFAFYAFTINTDTSEEYNYVGVDKCKMCHKSDKSGNQFGIWKESAHAKAFTTLQSEEANNIAKEKGFDTPAAETKECLVCHATGYDLDAGRLEKKYSVEDGVQCETCHGPGSGYWNVKKPSKTREENRTAAVEKGLVVHEDVAAYCQTCHNEKSPTFKGFNYEEMWKKIDHSVPSE